MRHQTSCFQLSPTNLLRGGAGERERVGNLLGDFGPPWTESTEFGLGVDEGFITPIKNLPSRWERVRKLEAGGQGWGGVQEPEGGREAASPATYPNELIRTL